MSFSSLWLPRGKIGGSIVVPTDTAPAGDDSVWIAYRREFAWPVYFLALARADTLEWDFLKSAAVALGAGMTRLTPHSADVLSLVRRTAQVPVTAAAEEEKGSGTFSPAGERVAGRFP